MKEIGIGLLGFGTVGAGVVEGLQQNGKLLADRLGVKLAVRRIADIDLERDRGVKVDRAILTRDAAAAVADPGVDIVIELIGGTGVAKELIRKSLSLGKPVVTANKALLAEHGREIFALAEKNGTDVHFEASVGGGIPIIRALREGLIANRIESIFGILNGTCNYILTRMERERLPFEQVLKEAQECGYAEQDPGLDIDGHDTAHKAVILASLAYGCHVPMKAVQVEGIRGLDRADIEYAADLGYRIKLLAVVKSVSGAIEVRVHPALVPLDHMLASVSGVFNAIMVDGDIVGQTLYYGRGAGRRPTASAIISDLADAARNLTFDSLRRAPAFSGNVAKAKLRKVGEIQTRYYLRISLRDKPGVLAQIASVLGRHGISIASVIQKETGAGDYAPVVIVTHFAKEKNFAAALRQIRGMRVVGPDLVRLRIEGMEDGRAAT